MQLRIPGPTPCPPQILQAMGRQMMNHRGPEFADLLKSITDRLRKVFQTTGDVLLLTASGSGGMESAIVNTLSPGDKVLSICNGFFGERFGDIAVAYGAHVLRLGSEWGKPVDTDAVVRELEADKDIRAVLMVHNETSTGMTNDLAQISSVTRRFDKLLLVDAISSMGCVDVPVDEWQCDVAVTGSQKGWMVPPGLAMVSISERAWQAHARAKMPRCYLDFSLARDALARGQTPWTPAISVCYALDTALDLMLREGLDSVFRRHARLGRKTRDGIKALGLSLFPDERYASDTVTAVSDSGGVDIPKLMRILREQHEVIVAGGMGRLSGKIFRIGHLGYVNDEDIELFLQALERALPQARNP
ncbi:MAG: pyridoxal-phosphate-dependent aminotransferase family protein [Dehalococcoidia bacterium]